MAIKKIRTVNGDEQIDYEGLANLPSSDKTLTLEGKFADSKTVGDKINELNNKDTEIDNKKLNKNFGSQNSGKSLIIGSNGDVSVGNEPIELDSTLTKEGYAGDAKIIGDKINILDQSVPITRYDDASEYTATPTSDAPIVINDLNGKTQQNNTNGYQLFDASKLLTRSQGGATVTNNNDGSFTISGSGNLTENYNTTYTYSKEKALKILKEGVVRRNFYGVTVVPRFIFGLRNKQTQILVSGKTVQNNSESFEVTSEDLQKIENEEYVLTATFYENNGVEIKPGTIKPMVYQEGNGEWEEYTGGQPSPSIEYNQDITGVGEDGKIEIICKTAQLFDASKLQTQSAGGATVTNNGDGSFTISGSGNLSKSFSYMASFTKEEALKILKVGKLYVSNDVLNKIPRFYFGIRSGNTYQEGKYVSGFFKEAEITAEDLKKIESGEYNLACGFYSSQNSTITPGTVKPMVYQNGEGTWQPFRSTLIQFPLTGPLYDGDKVCYVKPGESYIDENGDTVVADRILYGCYRENATVAFDGSEDEVWVQVGEGGNIYYRINLGEFGYVKDNESFCNKFISSVINSTSANIGFDVFNSKNMNVSVFVVRPGIEEVTDLTTFKTWLQSNPLTVLYKLATPYFEPFEDQTPFYNLRSFDDLTYIYSDDPLNPALTVGVAKNQTGGYVLESYNHSLKNQNVYNDIDERINNMLFADYDGKVYSTFFEDSTTSMASTGEKEDDNAGIANPVPSTDTVSNENPYDSIPLFKPIECNGYVDEEGNPHITAIKGSPEFKEDGSNGDVCIALKTGYIRTIVDTDGSILGKKGRKVSVTDTWRESEYPNHPFVPYTGAIRLDGSVRPYILIPKYQAVNYNDSYYSLPGLCPVYNVSHNNQITTFQKRGKQYCGETNSDAEIWETLFEIVFATLNSQSIMAGCTNYNYQYQVAKAESSVKRVIVTNSQANNILVGSCVSIGDKGTNSSVDRGNSYMHSLANRVLVTKKESLSDGANTAIYVDSSNSFTTTATTYISTMPWYTGATNSVKGTCGSPVDNLNGKYPFKFLGIEFALGQYIVRSDVILNGVYDSGANTYRQDIYTCLDCTKFATAITSDYAKVGYSIPDTNVTWLYISELGFDSKNPHVRMATKYGANSSQRYADAVYTGTRANGTREFLSLGHLYFGSFAGLRSAALSYSLSFAYWFIAARPSYTGRRGTVADWASAMGVTLAA